MQEVAEFLRRATQEGRSAMVGRVIDLKGFSTLPVDEIVAVDDRGGFHGDLLGRIGADRLGEAAPALLSAGAMATVGVEIHGPAVKELGLACGGRADVLMQPAQCIPTRVWAILAERSPVALVTVIDGPGAAPDALAVGRDGAAHGRLAPAAAEYADELAESARNLLSEGRTARRRVDTRVGVALVEAWVPAPRLVVVGSGEVVAAVDAQAGLLGWETRACDAVDEVDPLLDWAGATAALIVLSHDPHVDAPALGAGLARPIPYIGAMGSRGTQSRRLERLAAQGVPAGDLDRIHRPIGLNLGGRRASEVALAIVAEILAVHCGRDARPLSDTAGPIHG